MFRNLDQTKLDNKVYFDLTYFDLRYKHHHNYPYIHHIQAHILGNETSCVQSTIQTVQTHSRLTDVH